MFAAIPGDKCFPFYIIIHIIIQEATTLLETTYAGLYLIWDPYTWTATKTVHNGSEDYLAPGQPASTPVHIYVLCVCVSVCVCVYTFLPYIFLNNCVKRIKNHPHVWWTGCILLIYRLRLVSFFFFFFFNIKKKAFRTSNPPRCEAQETIEKCALFSVIVFFSFSLCTLLARYFI